MNRNLGDEERERLWERSGFLVRRLHQIHLSLFYERIGSHHLTPVQFGVLTVLSSGRLYDQSSLAEAVGLDRTNVADVVQRLERRGLIDRKVDSRDRRYRLISITEEGRQFVQKMESAVEDVQAELIEPLSKDDQDTFMGLIRQLVDAHNERGRTVLRL